MTEHRKIVNEALQLIPEATDESESFMRFLFISLNEYTAIKEILESNNELYQLFVRRLSYKVPSKYYYNIADDCETYENFISDLLFTAPYIKHHDIIESLACIECQTSEETPIEFSYRMENYVKEYYFALIKADVREFHLKTDHEIFEKKVLRWTIEGICDVERRLKLAFEKQSIQTFTDLRQLLGNRINRDHSENNDNQESHLKKSLFNCEMSPCSIIQENINIDSTDRDDKVKFNFINFGKEKPTENKIVEDKMVIETAKKINEGKIFYKSINDIWNVDPVNTELEEIRSSKDESIVSEAEGKSSISKLVTYDRFSFNKEDAIQSQKCYHSTASIKNGNFSIKQMIFYNELKEEYEMIESKKLIIKDDNKFEESIVYDAEKNDKIESNITKYQDDSASVYNETDEVEIIDTGFQKDEIFDAQKDELLKILIIFKGFVTFNYSDARRGEQDEKSPETVTTIEEKIGSDQTTTETILNDEPTELTAKEKIIFYNLLSSGAEKENHRAPIIFNFKVRKKILF